MRYVLRLILNTLAVIALLIVLGTAAYFIADPVASFAGWFNQNNIFYRAIILVIAPLVVAYADQVRDNLSEQDKRGKTKSLQKAFKQARDTQTPEILMRWLAWAALASVGIALAQIVRLL